MRKDMWKCRGKWTGGVEGGGWKRKTDISESEHVAKFSRTPQKSQAQQLKAY